MTEITGDRDQSDSEQSRLDSVDTTVARRGFLATVGVTASPLTGWITTDTVAADSTSTDSVGYGMQGYGNNGYGE